MRIISKARLRQFWETPGCEDSEGPLRAWYSHVSHRSVAWHSWAEVKAEIGLASLVGNCVVFNIGGNKYRFDHAHTVFEPESFRSEVHDPR